MAAVFGHGWPVVALREPVQRDQWRDSTVRSGVCPEHSPGDLGAQEHAKFEDERVWRGEDRGREQTCRRFLAGPSRCSPAMLFDPCTRSSLLPEFKAEPMRAFFALRD
jgi:hypothetical protein